MAGMRNDCHANPLSRDFTLYLGSDCGAYMAIDV